MTPTDWAAVIGASGTVLGAITTIVLAVITWRYVRLTQSLVDQNGTIVDESRRRETTRRRRMAVSLRDTAARLRTEFHALRGSYPGNISDERIRDHEAGLSSMLQLAIDVGAGTEAGALRARDTYSVWLRDGRAGAKVRGPEQEDLYSRAREAMAEAHAAAEEVLVAAEAFVKTGKEGDRP